MQPAGLTDVVARPGAYYAVWQPVAGLPLADLLAQPKKQEETVEALRELTANLAENGFALNDADVVLDGLEPRVAYLRPAPPNRTPEEVASLNQAALVPLLGGKIRRKRQPGAWLTFLPGLLFLGGAAYLGAQAAQVYLNPPVREVASVTGQNAQTAAGAACQGRLSGGIHRWRECGPARGRSDSPGSGGRNQPACGPSGRADRQQSAAR